ncbi:f-box domain containing protein, partial [Metarhizium majus ARSEF 297]
MQQSTCRGFENLPPELLLAIAEKLPADSRLVLSQTCSAFHNIIQSSQSTKCSVKTFDPSTFLDYLAAIARDLPDMWVCDKCMALHAADRQDTPQSPLTKSCPRTPMHRANGQRLCWPHHRHVQLALKYTRLGVRDPERRRHLAELLDPVFASHPPDIEDSWTARVTCSSRGKIVNGRFLLKYTWHYDAASEPIEYLSRGPGGYLVICNHQCLPGFLMAYIFQHVKQPGEEEATKLLSRGLRVLAEIVVRKATRESLLDDQRGMELTESCSECPTDFSVCVGEDGFWLSAWYDLGPEGSPFDEAWTSHRIQKPCGIVSDRLREGYVPGRIRRLYQQTAHQDIDDEFE